MAEVVPPRSATLNRRNSLSRINFEGMHFANGGTGSAPGSLKGKETWEDLPDLKVTEHDITITTR